MKFKVTYTVHMDYTVEIEAETPEHAREQAACIYEETDFSAYEVIDHDENWVALDSPAQDAEVRAHA